MPFAGKVAVVTGAAGATGSAVTRALHSRDTDVLAVDDDGDGLAELAAELDGLQTFVADVTRSDEVAAYVARAVERWGGIDLFFNNTDREGPVSSVPDTTEADFDEIVGANLRAAFLGLKHVLPFLRDGGAVVNMASELAVVGAAGLAGYVASKHGVLGLTKVAAIECERRGIRVNAICPGRFAEVDLVAEPASSLPFAAATETDGFRTPEEVADLVIFLLSDGVPLHHRPGAHVAANGAVTAPAAASTRSGAAGRAS